MSVAFATKCWKDDWQKLLAGGFARKWQALGYDFDELFLIINNGVPEGLASAFIGIADTIITSDNKKEIVLKHFGLTEASFQGGYLYSIAELTALYYAQEHEYFCYVQGDCLPNTGNWIEEGIALLEERPELSVISPSSEVNTWHNEFQLDQYFSDQCFLVRTAEFSGKIYTPTRPLIADYPVHGGLSFEHLVAQYLRESGQFRYILPHYYYEHPAY